VCCGFATDGRVERVVGVVIGPVRRCLVRVGLEIVDSHPGGVAVQTAVRDPDREVAFG
jgi:hypothetical protein